MNAKLELYLGVIRRGHDVVSATVHSETATSLIVCVTRTDGSQTHVVVDANELPDLYPPRKEMH